MRVIDADALKERWCANCDNKHLCGDKAGCDDVKELYDLPTIDAEPIIRCKDCKLNGTWDCPTNWNADEIMLMDDDDFCSYGDRKSEEASE